MEVWNFHEMMNKITRQVEEEKFCNKKETGQEFPGEKQKKGLKSGRDGGFCLQSRETGASHILLLEHAVYMDVECYQQKRSGHVYQFWSYIPGRKPPCLLFQSDQNRNLRHRHDFTEIIYVYSGTYTTEIGGKIYVFHERDFCLLYPGCEHREIELECEGIFLYSGFRQTDHKIIWKKYLTEGVIRDFLLTDGQKEEHPQFLLLSLPEEFVRRAENYFAVIFGELQEEELLSEEICRIHMIRFLNFLEEKGTDKRETLLPEQHPVRLYQRICNYVQEHLDTVDLSELKEHFFYQEDYYNRLFRKIEGRTFQKYLIHQKINLAKELLQDTSLSVQDIMRKTGYQSKPHFYACFKNETGMTPVQFRKKSLENKNNQ